jgi:hypothetical protein
MRGNVPTDSRFNGNLARQLDLNALPVEMMRFQTLYPLVHATHGDPLSHTDTPDHTYRCLRPG